MKGDVNKSTVIEVLANGDCHGNATIWPYARALDGCRCGHADLASLIGTIIEVSDYGVPRELRTREHNQTVSRAFFPTQGKIPI